MPEYADHEYWDDRYRANNNHFEWYLGWSFLREIIGHHFTPESRVLMIGCGNSRVSIDMYEMDHIHNITNIDISSVVIEQMQERYSAEQYPGMTWCTQDARAMTFDEGTEFDIVVDKGTLDAMLCGTAGPANGKAMFVEILKFLKPGGIFLDITYGAPDARTQYFEEEDLAWSVASQEIVVPNPDDPNEPLMASKYYIYTATKHSV
eukprot:gnl/Spiro4/2770_TR1347_c0_g1_i1.p1 gnl/Spiro4/2770_TR1347_c0_g1~~gnl/Spiro4/2770_TR1347_c0_g1_i1.p1  ORF type:complete len:206 (-),score=35.36 gnl/Spiro4/2770_TR1347_c0_g1_i1:29-646(-)